MKSRVIDWPERLAAYIEQHRHIPFAWGVHDCVTFACGWIETATGELPAPARDLQAYDSALGAKRAMLALGHDTLREAVSAALGVSMREDVEWCSRGDLVLVEDDEGREALGVCVGDQYAQPGEHGLVFKPVDSAIGFWPIGANEVS